MSERIAAPPFLARAESLGAGLDELRLVLPRHYEELSEHKFHGYPLAPDYNTYLRMEANGQILYVTLRGAEGLLAGYFVGFLLRDLHYGVQSLKMDILYVVPEARGHAGGATLVAGVEAEARRRGTELIVMNYKESHREHMERMLLAGGYAPFEQLVAKWI